MKKIVASVGLAALGASGIQTLWGQALDSPNPTKPWSVSATLRGFYDDNVNTIPNDQVLGPGEHRASYGFAVSPAVKVKATTERDTFSVDAIYSLLYYDTRPLGMADHNDQTFTFDGLWDHRFNERYDLQVADSFVVGQQPDMLRVNNEAFTGFQRVSGDNIRNSGTIDFNAQLTPTWGMSIGYENDYFDYSATGPSLTPVVGAEVLPSPAGVLNRIENAVHLEALWTMDPPTKFIAGYKFRDTDYTGNELVDGFFNGAGIVFPVFSSDRNAREHTLYLGVQHNFQPNLMGALRAGASYQDSYNAKSQNSNYAPYADGSLTYAYAADSTASLGVHYDFSAYYLGGLDPNTGNFSTGSEAATVWGQIAHHFTPNLTGSVIANLQNSTIDGGRFDGQTEQYYGVGLNVDYAFNHNLSAHAGYNYDRLNSQRNLQGAQDPSYDRNRVYIGITAAY